jgi:mono/diheme cytochrome c family protein
MTRFSAAVSTAALLLASSAALAAPAATQAKPADAKQIERGRYLVKVAGCNDCHTPGYGESGGKTAEAQWLTGDRLGWRGPWGTTYAPNLRLHIAKLSEAEWIKQAKTQEYRPPMPWYSLHAMAEPDLRAIYRFVHHLGPAGEPAPAYLPPNQEPPQPYVTFPAPPKR